MASRRWRISDDADTDIEDILRYTTRQFGPAQRDIYATLIETAMRLLAEDPARPGTRRVDEFRPGLCGFHLSNAARRRGAASHVIYFLGADQQDGELSMVRVLHERMDPARHLSLPPPDPR